MLMRLVYAVVIVIVMVMMMMVWLMLTTRSNEANGDDSRSIIDGISRSHTNTHQHTHDQCLLIRHWLIELS